MFTNKLVFIAMNLKFTDIYLKSKYLYFVAFIAKSRYKYSISNISYE